MSWLRALALTLPTLLAPTLVHADLATAQRQVDAQQLDAAEATLEAHLAQQPDDNEATFLLARVRAWP